MQTKFKKFNKVPLFISILFFLASLGVLIFLYRNIDSNNTVSEQAAVESQAETSRREEIKSLDQTLKATVDEQAELDTHFVRSGNVVPLLDSIEMLAPMVKAKAEVTQVDISPDNTSLTLGVNVTGSFESVYKFITLLENSNYQLEIISMDLQKTSDSAPAPVTPTVPAPAVPADAATSGTTAATDTSTASAPAVVQPKTIKIPQWSAVLRIKLLSYLKS